jgi:hypothetical protein
MEFEFINRIWSAQLGKSKARKVLLFTLGGIILLLNFFQALMEGFGKVNWLTGLGVPVLLIGIGLMGTKRGGYVTSACTLTLNREMLCVTYPAIDFQDKRGPHTEVHAISKNDIETIQYSAQLKSLRIVGRCKTIGVLSDNSKVDGTAWNGGRSEVVLYPPSEKIQDIITAFETVLGINVVQMDEIFVHK